MPRNTGNQGVPKGEQGQTRATKEEMKGRSSGAHKSLTVVGTKSLIGHPIKPHKNHARIGQWHYGHF